MITDDPQLVSTRVELMERVEAAWAEIDRLLIDLDAHQLSVKPADGAWSIKDLLAHLAAWLESAVALLAGRDRAEAMGVKQEIWESGSEDEVNAEIERIWAKRSPTDVLAALRTAQAALREQISALDDEDLARTYSHFQPNDLPYNPAPVIGWITGNTYDHVGAHLPALQALRAQVT